MTKLHKRPKFILTYLDEVDEFWSLVTELIGD